MKFRITLIGGALVAAMALPVTAEAHRSVSPSTVAKHVRSADAALGMVDTLVERERDAKAAVALAKLRRQSRAADREAASLRRRARSARSRARAASITVKVARLHEEAAEVLAGIVDQAGGRTQGAIAVAVDSELQGRERAIVVLTRLMDRLPERARAAIAKAIARLSSDGADEVASITEALAGESLTPKARAELEDALQRATAAIDRAIERLNSLSSRVPEQARPYVEQAVGRATQQLGMVKDILAGAFGGGDGQGAGSAPVPAGVPVPTGSLCQLPVKLPFTLPGC